MEQYRKYIGSVIAISLILGFLLVYPITKSKDTNEQANASGLILVQPTLLVLSAMSPTATPIPTNTAIAGVLPTSKHVERSYAPTQTQIALESVIPNSLNELSYNDFVIMPPDVRTHIREIFADGKKLGRDPHVFTRVGDSTIEYPVFLTNFDTDKYNLGDYSYLQEVIDYYAGSFDHRSMAVRRGLHTWSVFDPMWATSPCESGEDMLACEFRLDNPSILFIRLGSNDAGIPKMTDESIRDIVAYSIEQGVIPILGTKADRIEGSNSTNDAIRQIAKDYAVPLWDFDVLASTLPDKGIGSDRVHLTFFFPYDWEQKGGFTTGHGLNNLSALIMLDAVWHVLTEQNE